MSGHSITFSLPAPMITRLRAAADAQKISVDVMVATALGNYLADQKLSQIFIHWPISAPREDLTVTLFDPLAKAIIDTRDNPSSSPDSRSLEHIVARALHYHLDKLDGIVPSMNHSLRLAPQTHARLRQLATAQGTNPDTLIRRALDDYLDLPNHHCIPLEMPAYDNPYMGVCRISSAQAGGLARVVRLYDRPGQEADGTLIIARAVQYYLDVQQHRQNADMAAARQQRLHAHARKSAIKLKL